MIFHFTNTKVVTAVLSLLHHVKNLLKFVIEFKHCDKKIMQSESDVVAAVVHCGRPYIALVVSSHLDLPALNLDPKIVKIV